MRPRRPKIATLDFSDRGPTRRWFEAQPREVSVPIAVRAALRALPTSVAGENRENFDSDILSFRAVMVSWAAAKYSPTSAELRAKARAASVKPAYPISAAALAAASTTGAAAANYAGSVVAFASRAVARGSAADAALIDKAANLSERVALAASLYEAPLWLDKIPPAEVASWRRFQFRLHTREDWRFLIDWYEDRLAGRPSLGEAFDLAVAALPDELWRQGPAAVNARIKELIAEHTPAGSIPAQGAGPHFALSPDLKIALAPLGEIDAAGNNMARIGNLLPVVRQTAGDLAGHLNPNTQPEISRIVGDYRAAIAGETQTIAWGTLFGLGVRLENAAAASRRDIADRLRDPLEDAPQEALDSLLTLHGPLILATADGRELTDEADRFRMTDIERTLLRQDALEIVEDLSHSPDLIDKAATEAAQNAAEAANDGPHPERGQSTG